MLTLSRTLDHVGVFAGSVDDAALLAEVLMDYDAGDARHAPAGAAASSAAAPPKSRRCRRSSASSSRRYWDRAEPDTQAAFAELVDLLGDSVDEIELSSMFANAVDMHRTIQDADIAMNFAPEYEKGREQLSAATVRDHRTRPADCGRRIHSRAARIPLLNDTLGDVYRPLRCDPDAGGARTKRRWATATGDPIFCTTWTLLGMPAITLPLLQGGDGMPVGVQLVGERGHDGRLLRTANWLTNVVAAES